MADTQSLLELIKDRLPKHVSLLLSVAFFVATALINFSSSRTHFADIQTEQGKRISALEDVVRNDIATRREVDDVKTTVERIENKLDNLKGK